VCIKWVCGVDMARLIDKLDNTVYGLIKEGPEYKLFTTLERLGLVEILYEMTVFNDYISVILRSPE
jgi:hypothetical protein